MNASSKKQNLTAREVYCRVIDEPDADRRDLLVAKLCSGNPQLQRRVQDLMDARSHASEGVLARVIGVSQNAETDRNEASLLETQKQTPDGVSSSLNGVSLATSSLTGQHLGPYKLMELLGEGGMGAVYRAKQLEPVEREVALKVIKPDSNSVEAIKRFAQERQSMALMQHPNIASVFDGGEAADGCHYLVMELVYGVPIDQYCQENDLQLEQRLELFMELGRAIAHAHSKNIIHRDLKPSNILVTTVDGSPMVKVIDFGIAKSIRCQLELEIEQTRTGKILGTPLYQAPEQLDASSVAVDVRCDVYALGVILYKLLTGTTPIERDLMAQAGYDGLLQKLAEQDYDAPSVRIIKLAGDSGANLSCEGMATIPKSRRRELDWIVLNTLHPNPDLRYGSVVEVLDDLSRFLRHEPISVGPPRRWAPLRRWARLQRVRMAMAIVFGGLTAAVSYIAVKDFYSNSYSNDQRLANEDFSTRDSAQPNVVKATPKILDSAALWRETAQLQLGVSAFRESDYSAIRETIESASTRPPANARLRQGEDDTRFDLRRMLFNAAHPEPTFQLPGSTDVQAAAYSEISARLVVATKTGEVRLYSLQHDDVSQPPIVLGTHPGRVDAIAISPDGSRAVSGTDSLWFWDLDSAQLARKGVLLDAGIESIVWSPDGKTIAAGSRYDCIWVGDQDGNELFKVSNDHRHEDLVFLPDSRSLLVPTREGIDEYQVPSGKRLRTISVKPLENVRTMALAGNRMQHLIVADRFEDTAIVMDLTNGNQIGSLPLDGNYPQCFRTTGSGKWVTTLYPDGKCALMQIDSSNQENVGLRNRSLFQFSKSRQLSDDDRLELLWIKPMQQFLTLGGSEQSKLWEWDRVDPVQIKSPPMELWDVLPGASDELVFFPKEPSKIGDRAYYVGISRRSNEKMGDPLSEPAGIFSQSSSQQIVASLGDQVLEIIDLNAAGKIIARIECEGLLGQRRLSLSRDGSAVAVGNDAQIRVWTTRDQWKTWQFREFSDISPDVLLHLSDDGRSLWTNTGGIVREIKISSGETVRSYDDLRLAAPWKIEIDDLSGRVIIGKRDSLSVMDRVTGKLIHKFHLDSEVTSILPVRDSSNLITGHRDGSIRAWHLATMQPLGIVLQPKQSLGRISRLEVFPDRNRILAVARNRNQLSVIIIGN
jgi:serine/threonine protein kinase/WD40 repeat protein